MLGRFKYKISKFQHMRNNYAKYTLCCVFVNNNPKDGTINNFSQVESFIFNNFAKHQQKFPFFSTRPFVNYFVLNISHK